MHETSMKKFGLRGKFESSSIKIAGLLHLCHLAIGLIVTADLFLNVTLLYSRCEYLTWIQFYSHLLKHLHLSIWIKLTNFKCFNSSLIIDIHSIEDYMG